MQWFSFSFSFFVHLGLGTAGTMLLLFVRHSDVESIVFCFVLDFLVIYFPWVCSKPQFSTPMFRNSFGWSMVDFVSKSDFEVINKTSMIFWIEGFPNSEAKYQGIRIWNSEVNHRLVSFGILCVELFLAFLKAKFRVILKIAKGH